MKIERGYLRLPEKRARMCADITPVKFAAPVKVGNWEYFLAPEKQGSTPQCAAFAECSILQAAAWRSRRFGYPVQYDEGALYRAAKAIDGDKNDGTSLESIIAAAELLPGVSMDTVMSEKATDIPWIIHQFGAVLAGLAIDDGWLAPRAKDGLVTPGGAALGGHAVVISWYDLEKGRAGGPNWWGQGWGMRGYWSMDLNNLAEQFIYGYGQAIDFGKARAA